MKWSQEEMNILYSQIQKKAAVDIEFRKRLIENPKVVIEEISNRTLPEGFNVKFIERDPNYNLTFAIPDFIGEAVDDSILDGVAGGVDADVVPFLLVLGACAAAVTLGPCVVNACGANARVG